MKAQYKNTQALALLKRADLFAAPSRAVPQLSEAQIAFYGGLAKTSAFSMSNQLMAKSKKSPSAA